MFNDNVSNFEQNMTYGTEHTYLAAIADPMDSIPPSIPLYHVLQVLLTNQKDSSLWESHVQRPLMKGVSKFAGSVIFSLTATHSCKQSHLELWYSCLVLLPIELDVDEIVPFGINLLLMKILTVMTRFWLVILKYTVMILLGYLLMILVMQKNVK